jgi:ABC-2 type transport system ATP-binding protein
VNQILASDGYVAARVKVSDHLRATEILSTAGFTVERLPNLVLKVSLVNHKLDLAVITRLLADQGLYVSELTPIQPDLESVFLNLTAGEQRTTTREERRRQPAGRPPQQRPRRTAQQQRRPGPRRQQELPDWSGRP